MQGAAATLSGKFEKEIVPNVIRSKKGETVFKTDEGIRPDTTKDTLAKLKPAFKETARSQPGTPRS